MKDKITALYERLSRDDEQQGESKTQEAKDLICALLAGGKEVLSEEIDRAAVAKGISPRTVRDAKKELGTVRDHRKTGPSAPKRRDQLLSTLKTFSVVSNCPPDTVKKQGFALFCTRKQKNIL